MSTAIKFKVARHVTVPQLKIKPEVPIHVRFEEAIKQSEPLEGARIQKGEDGKPLKQPPKVARVVNLETGEDVQIVVGSILDSELNKAYPDDKYVGKSFQIVQHKLQGKAYNSYSITEIVVESDEEPAPPKGKKAA